MQKNIKKGMCRLISTVLFAVMCLSTMFVNTTEVYASGEAKQGVVVVAWYIKDVTTVAVKGGKIYGEIGKADDGILYTGTGFFVGKEGEPSCYIATNCHNVEDYVASNNGGDGYYDSGNDIKDGGIVYDVYYKFQSSEMRIYYSKNEFEVVKVIDSGSAGTGNVDLAILKLDEPSDKRQTLKLLVPTEDMVGKDVYAVGFPGLSENSLSSASKWGINDVTVTKGVINRLAAVGTTGLKTIQMDAQISGGNSGGPLVDEKGNVVGINTWGVSKGGSSTQYAINVSELITMLDRNNVPYELASTKTATADVDDSKGDNNTVVIIACVAVAVVLVVIIIAVCVSMGKKKNTQAANTPNAAYAPNISGAASTGKRTPMLRSLATQHKGACFAVSNTTLFIGRDPSVCKITFKEGSVGVSGKHCSIMYREDTNEFVLTDLGSTYGTFLANGQRLQPNIAYRLKSGETFYVGDKANILLVEVK